ncbi:MAG: hypothetical protein D6723_04750, partial [Acidobacteria bacterium]
MNRSNSTSCIIPGASTNERRRDGVPAYAGAADGRALHGALVSRSPWTEVFAQWFFRRLVVMVIVSMLWATTVAASGARRTLPGDPKRAEVTRVHSRISVDGVLSEPEWAEVESIGALIQREPRPGESATEPTE